MGQDTKIEWAHHSWNPWWGCQRVSAGCQHCYAETLAHRYRHEVWGPAATTSRRAMSERYWQQPLAWDRAAREAGVRARVFCASMADVFEDHPQVEPWRARLWRLIEETTHLDWLLLTKRPEHIDKMLPQRWEVADQGMPRNVWLGFSAEDQQRFDERWPVMEWLRRMWNPAVVFLSAEPLLGPLDISEALVEVNLGDEEHHRWSGTLDWVICGGESGPGARPMHPTWAQSLRDQCQAAGVSFFFKQWGAYSPHASLCAGDHWPSSTILLTADGTALQRGTVSASAVPLHRVGKKAAGRAIDGRTWDEVPR